MQDSPDWDFIFQTIIFLFFIIWPLFFIYGEEKEHPVWKNKGEPYKFISYVLLIPSYIIVRGGLLLFFRAIVDVSAKEYKITAINEVYFSFFYGEPQLEIALYPLWFRAP